MMIEIEKAKVNDVVGMMVHLLNITIECWLSRGYDKHTLTILTPGNPTVAPHYVLLVCIAPRTLLLISWWPRVSAVVVAA